MICPYCKEKVKTWAEKCKHCQWDFTTEEGKKKLKEANKTTAFTWILTVIIIFIITSSIIGSQNSEKVEITSWSCDSTMKEVISNQYKSPSTVKFINCRWDKAKGIYGEADAWNALWGTIRTSFLCNGDSCLITPKK